MSNKTFAVKRGDDFWAVIHCGVYKEGGMSVGNYWATHFRKEGEVYRWYDRIFEPPETLKEWDEITVITKQVTVIDKEGHLFEGWEDAKDLCYTTLQRFAARIGRPMSIKVIKTIVELDNEAPIKQH